MIRSKQRIARQNRQASGWQIECEQIQRNKARQIRRQTWRKRLGYGAAGMVVSYVALLGWWLMQSGELTRFEQGMEIWARQQMVRAGLAVQQVHVLGADRLSAQAVVNQAGIVPGMPIFSLSLTDIKQRLERHPQIADATLSRLFPNRLDIRIEERKAAAIWQSNNASEWIDREGVVLSREWVQASSAHVPVISGKGAPRQMAGLWQLLESNAPIAREFRAAQWVGGRRWNLWLKSDIKILLPENNAAGALARLNELQQTIGLLDRAVAQIDLRLSDRAFIVYKALPESDEKPLPAGRAYTVTAMLEAE